MALTVAVTQNGVPYENAAYHILPQVDGSIVFHLGLLGPLPADELASVPFDLQAHVVTISNESTVVLTQSIPVHPWGAEWTYRPWALSSIKTPEQLVAANRMFPFGNAGVPVPPQPARVPYAKPFDTSDITLYMPTTGERPDIGWQTDNVGYWMLGGSPLPMFDWAQAANGIPGKFRDEATGAPIDLAKYPQANAYDLPGYQGSPWLPKGVLQSNGYTQYGGGWTPQQAHYPSLSYAAYQASGNLGFLSDLQYQANFMVLGSAVDSNATNGAVLSGETRGTAWAFLALFKAWRATKDQEALGALPTGFMPSSYFDKLLMNAITFYSPAMSDPTKQTLRLIAETGEWAPWQADYRLTAFAFGVLVGYTAIIPMYLWSLGNVIARTNNTSGFPPGYGTPYYCSTQTAAGVPFSSWTQLYEDMQTSTDGNINDGTFTATVVAQLAADPLNGGKAWFAGGHEYMMTTRAALVMADYLDKQGLASVRVEYPELDTCLNIAQTMFVNNGTVNARVSVVSITGEVPPPPIVIPPTPSSGGNTVTTNLTIGIPQHFTLGLAYPLQAGMTPSYSVSPSGSATLTPDANNLGVTVTGVLAAQGAVLTSAALTYPDGDVVPTATYTFNILAPEDKTQTLTLG